MLRVGLPDLGDELDEELRVAVGDVQADELQLRDGGDYVGEALVVSLRGSGAHRRVGDGVGVLGGELLPGVDVVVLVQARVAIVLERSSL